MCSIRRSCARAATCLRCTGPDARSSDRDGNDEIYRMQVNGSLQTLLSNNLANDTEPDWQPLNQRRR